MYSASGCRVVCSPAFVLWFSVFAGSTALSSKQRRLGVSAVPGWVYGFAESFRSFAGSQDELTANNE